LFHWLFDVRKEQHIFLYAATDRAVKYRVIGMIQRRIFLSDASYIFFLAGVNLQLT